MNTAVNLMNSFDMKPNRLPLETIFFILLLLLALGLRFYNLGTPPLSDAEADWALQALQVAQPTSVNEGATIGPQPVYVLLTGALFALFGANNFLARFWPALAGGLLVLLPGMFQRKLGRIVALIVALGLSLDPGLVAVSRQVGGPMMALSFGLFALGFWWIQKPILSGLLLGLAILSGPAIITGALGLGLAWVITRYFVNLERSKVFFTGKVQEVPLPDLPAAHPKVTNTRLVLLSAGITILLAGTFFFRYPQGLSAWFQTLPAYFAGWMPGSGANPFQLIVALLVYQPFVLIFALVGIVRWLVRHSLGEVPGSFPLLLPLIWVIISLIIILLYPSRQVNDLVWTLVPLWILAAASLEEYLPHSKTNPISILQAGLILVLSALFWNTMITTSQIITSTMLQTIGLRFGILLGILSLGALTTILVSLGWSWEVSRNGLVWGLTAIFSIYMIATMWGASQLRANQPSELWGRPPATGQVDLFISTMQDLSNWSTGFSQRIDTVSTVDTPSLRWVLNDQQNVRFTSGLPVGTLPSVIITRQEQEAPSLTESYRGQDFVWWVKPGWSSVLPPNTIDWLTFRKAPLLNEKLILWVRSDLFPGGILESNTDLLEIP